ncbi:hypothetical protein CRYUN_Cryun03dG0117500 [Craigia yunnanensis]
MKPSHDSHNHLQLSKDSLNSNEWGDISSEDEAIMLETQVTLLFSQIPEGPSYRLSHRSHEQSGLGRSILQAVSRPQSSFLMDQRLLRQQKDEEYLTSLLADKEKEMNALKKVENSLKEEFCRRKPEGEEVEVVMAAKVTSLPPEPAIDDENAEKCSEDFDLLGLCCHIDEEHHLGAGYGFRPSLDIFHIMLTVKWRMQGAYKNGMVGLEYDGFIPDGPKLKGDVVLTIMQWRSHVEGS